MTEMIPPFAELAEMKKLDADAPVTVRKKRATKHDFKDGRGRVFAHRHVNGEGWVADTAKVEDSVFVAKTAQVYHCAVIWGKAQVRNRAHVCGNVEIMDHACVEHTAQVSGNTIIADSSKVRDNARVYGGVLQGSTMVRENSAIRDNAWLMDTTVRDNCVIYGRAKLFNSALRYDVHVGGNAYLIRATIDGYVHVRGDAVIKGSAISNMRAYSSNKTLNAVNIWDHATIVNVSRIDAWVDFIGHATVVGGTINFRPDYSGNDYVKLTTDTQATFVALEARSPATFTRYNVPPAARANVVAADNMAARVQSGQRMPVNLDTLTPARRIMSFDGAAT
jgi:carbonic anhydrase/acetyltransferase-like protein (isoleucine patch superfamily)